MLEVSNNTSGQEIWRLSFKDYPSKNKINTFFKNPRHWGLEFWGENKQVWKEFEVWGRWTEGTVGKIIRDSANTIWRALIEAVGKEALWARDGCSIDYRMSSICEKFDRTPGVVVIYPEQDADPKIYVYSYSPNEIGNERTG